MLDLACGSGRHSILLAGMGHFVLAVDNNAEALENLAGQLLSSMQAAAINTLCVDLEQAPGINQRGIFTPNRFAAIVVTNYLHRPLFPLLLASLATGGVLIYETFAQGNATFGKPSNPDFLLAPGELVAVLRESAPTSFRIIAYEDGYVELPRPAMLQRICAIKVGPALLPWQLRLV